jgi:hypothetical protein
MGTGKTALVLSILASLAGADALCRSRKADAAATSGATGVDVYIWNETAVPFQTVVQGKAMAARIFAQIGITVRFHWGDPPQARGPNVIAVRMGPAPANATDNSLGSALLQSRLITLYLDRIRDVQAHMPNVGPALFGHLLAHEIGHVLQGVPRHSEVGILKPSWSGGDYARMCAGALAFTLEDIERMRLGPVLKPTLTILAIQRTPEN